MHSARPGLAGGRLDSDMRAGSRSSSSQWYGCMLDDAPQRKLLYDEPIPCIRAQCQGPWQAKRPQNPLSMRLRSRPADTPHASCVRNDSLETKAWISSPRLRGIRPAPHMCAPVGLICQLQKGCGCIWSIIHIRHCLAFSGLDAELLCVAELCSQ